VSRADREKRVPGEEINVQIAQTLKNEETRLFISFEKKHNDSRNQYPDKQ